MRSWPVALLGLLLVLSAVWLLSTHRVGLWEPTEARYADIAWRMVETGDWWTPHFNFLPHFHKPAPAYWPPAVSLLLLGQHPWAPRISSLVLALLCLVLTYSWGRRMWGASHGFLASMILGTTVLVTMQVRVLSADFPLSAAVLLSLWAAWEVLCGESGKKRWVWIYWLSLGAGFAIKGPVVLILALLPVGLYVLVAGRRSNHPHGGPSKLLGRLHWKLGILAFAVVALPWFISMSIQHRGLLDHFLENQVLSRVTSSVHERPGPIYYYVGILAGGFFPWTAALAWSSVHHLRRPWSAWKLWSLCIWAPCFVVFSFSGSKLPAYILPLFPIWSLQAGRWILDEGRHSRAVMVLTGLLLILGGGVSAALAFSLEELTTIRGILLPGAIALFLGGFVVLWWARRKQGGPGWVLATASTWIVFFLFVALSLPVWGHKSGALLETGRRASALLQENPRVKIVAFACHPGSLSFFGNRMFRAVGTRRETDFMDPDLARRFILPHETNLDSLRAEGAILWVTKTKKIEDLKRRLGAPLQEIAREGPWVLLRVSDDRSRGFTPR